MLFLCFSSTGEAALFWSSTCHPSDSECCWDRSPCVLTAEQTGGLEFAVDQSYFVSVLSGRRSTQDTAPRGPWKHEPPFGRRALTSEAPTFPRSTGGPPSQRALSLLFYTFPPRSLATAQRFSFRCTCQGEFQWPLGAFAKQPCSELSPGGGCATGTLSSGHST